MKEGHNALTLKLPLHRIGIGGAMAQHTKGMGMSKWRKGAMRDEYLESERALKVLMQAL